MESLHFHGARHGEHHERFFIKMSAATEFLLYVSVNLAWITSPKAVAMHLGLRQKVVAALKPFIYEADFLAR